MATAQNRVDTNVFVDATVVRMVLVPAVMQLVGSANWGLPGWIGRAAPNLAIGPDVDHLAGGGLVCARPVGAEVIPAILPGGAIADSRRR